MSYPLGALPVPLEPPARVTYEHITEFLIAVKIDSAGRQPTHICYASVLLI